MIIGVSGKTGSGKSSVAKYIGDKLGYAYLDIDVLSKKIRNKYKKEIVNLVNDDILDDGEIDSKLLGNMLFNDKELMNKYNAFIYSKQLIEINNYISEHENVVLDSMFLPIMNEIFEIIDYKILVYLDDYKRMLRCIKRDNISEEYYKKRDSYSLKYNNDDFDLIVNNDFDYKQQVDVWLESNF